MARAKTSKIPLLGGTYVAKSVVASAQRCVNLYPEINPQTVEAEVPVTHYLAPGLRLLATPPASGYGRGLFLASNGSLYAVINDTLYAIDHTFTMFPVGTIPAGSTPVSMTDNGANLILVTDTMGEGWQVILSGNHFSTISDPAFFGSTRVEYIDTFLIFNQIGTKNFYTSLSNQVTPLDPLYIAAKTGFTDSLVAAVVTHREIWLIGEQTTEIWYDAGNPQFPFAIVPGVFISLGCAAKYSIAKYFDPNGIGGLFWVSKSAQGTAIVVFGSNYRAIKVSNQALEQEWATYATVDDAVGFTYQLGGHVFYQVTFQSANKTWTYDQTTDQWHQRTWTDGQGQEQRHRAQFAVEAFGKIVAIDWEFGFIYELSSTAYSDGNNPIVWRRGFPHMVADGRRASYTSFIADMEVGTVASGSNPEISLRWSDDRGKTWGNALLQSMGSEGEYLTSIQWNRLGLARDRVFELFGSLNAPMALNGAYVSVDVAET